MKFAITCAHEAGDRYGSATDKIGIPGFVKNGGDGRMAENRKIASLTPVPVLRQFLFGHGPDLHYVDKTDSDVEKTVRMAISTWYSLREYARAKKCNCLRDWEDASWSEVRRFAKTSGGSDYREINISELDMKRQILGVPWR